MRYKITIEYDGTAFCGWQRQENASNTVQEILEKAIFALTGEIVAVFGSGRTDTGVHAIGQVAHFDLQKEWDVVRIRDGINFYLSRSIYELEKVVRNRLSALSSGPESLSSYYENSSLCHPRLVTDILLRNNDLHGLHPTITDQPMETSLRFAIRESVLQKRLDHGTVLNVRGGTDRQSPSVMNPVEKNLYETAHCCGIIKVEIVDDTFHARFDAVSRTYHYYINNQTAPLVLNRNRMLHIRKPLDVDLMREGAKIFLGKHDFNAFRSAHCQAANAIRTIDAFDIFSDTDKRMVSGSIFGAMSSYAASVSSGDKSLSPYVESVSSPTQSGIQKHSHFHTPKIIIAKITARSFLHNQIRIMMGTLIKLGHHQLTLEELKKILDSGKRELSGPTIAPGGLYLAEIRY